MVQHHHNSISLALLVLFFFASTSSFHLSQTSLLLPRPFRGVHHQLAPAASTTITKQLKTRLRFNPHFTSSSLLFSEPDSQKDPVDETTEKYGLEAGLYKAVTSPETTNVKPADLLKKYGIAYLATSITLALISFGLCYILVANGVDVAALLKKVGIESTAATANVGTLGIAYTLHKAASPIRFPPTVALTPVVAGWLGNKKEKNDDSNTNA